MKKDDKINNTVSTLNYFTAVCFYIVSIINFVSKDNTMGIFYLCLGTTFMCLGTVWLNKDKDKNKK